MTEKMTESFGGQIVRGPSDPQVSSALEELGINANDIAKFVEEHDRKPVGREVCLCGHALNKHTELVPGVITCVTARIWCPCQTPSPVIAVQDTRYFMRTTYGYGPKHALSTGLYALTRRGKWSHLVCGPRCFRCSDARTELAPAAIDAYGRISTKPTPQNVLLCPRCILDLLGILSETVNPHAHLSSAPDVPAGGEPNAE